MASKRSKIKIDPYEALLHLVISDNVEKTKKSLIKKKLFTLEDSGEAEAWFIYDDPDEREYWIIIPTDATPGLIAHEVSHLVNKLLNTCGVSIDNDEASAYLIGFLVDKIWSQLALARTKLEGKDKDDSESK